jgi:hypothetical protein
MQNHQVSIQIGYAPGGILTVLQSPPGFERKALPHPYGLDFGGLGNKNTAGQQGCHYAEHSTHE